MKIRALGQRPCALPAAPTQYTVFTVRVAGLHHRLGFVPFAQGVTAMPCS